MPLPPKFNVLGVGVHTLRFSQALDLALDFAKTHRARRASIKPPDARETFVERETSGERAPAAAHTSPAARYICFCDANSISCARRDPAHREALNRAALVTPDGMPLVWMGRRQMGRAAVERVYGPDMMLALCEASATLPQSENAPAALTHFFYGGAEGTAGLLAEKLSRRFPGLTIAGTMTPPFRELTAPEADALIARINQLKPDLFWVGLGTPKQEKFMLQYAARLDTGVMLGVGAAFDFLSGRVRQAPRWMRRCGLEWLFRLCTEPRRLAVRYLRNAPKFALLAAAQRLGLKKFPMR